MPEPVDTARSGPLAGLTGDVFLDLGGFDYVTSEDVREELKGRVGESRPDAAFVPKRTLNGEHSQGVAADVPMYQIDAVVRRAPALQRTREAQQAAQRAEQR